MVEAVCIVSYNAMNGRLEQHTDLEKTSSIFARSPNCSWI